MEILATLSVEQHIVAAGLYDRNGKLFAKYPENEPAATFPTSPKKDGHRFEHAHLSAFQPVVQGANKRLGTLYLKSDMGAMFERFRLYGGIVVLVITGTFIVAYTLSRALQKQISQPILALAETAKAVSARRDFSVRAGKMGGGELGLLTDAFNQMLTQIHEQNRALMESERRFRALIENSSDAIALTNAAGIILYLSPSACRIEGFSPEESVGRHAADHVHPRDMPQWQQSFEEVLATPGRPLYAQWRRERKNGEWRWYEGIRTNLLDEPSVRAVVTNYRDITERKQAEEALRASETNYRQIFNTANEAIFVHDMETGAILDINDSVCRTYGFTREEFLHADPHEMSLSESPYTLEDAMQWIQKAVHQGPQTFEWLAKHKSERQFWVEMNLKRGVIGGQDRILAVVRDITERKQADTRLQGQLSRLDLLHRITRAIGERQDLPSIFQVIIRSLEDNLPIDFGCVCLYDSTAEILSVASVGARSGALALELGLTEQARITIDQNGLARCVRGQLVYEPDVSQVPFPFPQRLAGGGLRSLVAAPLLVEGRVFGILLAARGSAQSFSSADCEFLRQLSEHVALAAHQAKLYGALQQAYDDLRQSQHAVMQQERLRALGQMASGIAHDINNAISPVALYTESLLEREANLSERARNYLATIQRAIEDVAQTVSRMREFYRQREPQLVLARIELDRIVQQVIDLTRVRWRDLPQERGIVINLQTDLEPGLPGIMGAEGEIRDALTNLIFNAADAMPEGGTLTLRVRAVSAQGREDEHESAAVVHLEVSDTGVGMDEETKRRCLEPFFTTKGERGTGLGLAMVYGMVQRHSAEIEIDSEPGKGTTVRLIFSVAAPAITAAARPSAPPLPAHPLRILVVDDDPLVMDTLRNTLSCDGHLVTTADGGQVGIHTFEASHKGTEPFAVVVTDLGMPYVDGRKVAASVKAVSPGTPVILLTGWGQRLTDEQDIPLGVDRVLSKPPTLQELREALAEVTAGVAQTRST